MGAWLSVAFTAYAPPLGPGASVLVTGCDTGFGRLLATQLTARGFRVFASCLTEAGRQALVQETGAAPNLTAFLLDVTQQDQIDACARLVEKHCPQGLNALVNNAGVVAGWRVDWSTPQDFRRTMDVNFHGMVGMILAHMDLLRRAQTARIVNVSSVAGILAAPFMGPYASSKHAIEGFSDVLRIELREVGIPVCVIEPTFHRTNLISHLDHLIEASFKNASRETQEFYGEEYGMATKEVLRTRLKLGRNPQNTVDCMIAALTDSHPRHRYREGLGAKSVFLLMNKLPTFWTDPIIAGALRTILPTPKGMQKRLRTPRSRMGTVLSVALTFNALIDAVPLATLLVAPHAMPRLHWALTGNANPPYPVFAVIVLLLGLVRFAAARSIASASARLLAVASFLIELGMIALGFHYDSGNTLVPLGMTFLCAIMVLLLVSYPKTSAS